MMILQIIITQEEEEEEEEEEEILRIHILSFFNEDQTPQICSVCLMAIICGYILTMAMAMALAITIDSQLLLYISPHRLSKLIRGFFFAEIIDAMNDVDVSKQVQQMVRFIRQEAEEKANEIAVSAEEV